MGVKIAVVGGGSTYTPELVEGFAAPARPPADRRAGPARHRPRAARDRRRPRPADARPARLGRPARPAPATATPPSTAPTSCSSSSASAARPARLVDETLPPRFGVIGQETTGAGGFAKALRTVPVVLELAELTAPARRARRLDRRLHQPGRDRHPGAARRAATGRSACATSRSTSSATWPSGSASTPDRVELEHVGLNHLSWERAVRVDGVDRLPELLERRSPTGSRTTSGMPAELVRALGRSRPTTCATTTRPREVVEEQRAGHTRAQDVIDIEAQPARAVPRPDARPRSRRCSPTAAARSTARRPPS